MTIQRVAVIGSGVMGSAIAAHFANAGVPVHLLDIVPDDQKAAGSPDRSRLARTAIEKMLKTDPAPFMHPKNAKLVTPGNLEDDLKTLADVDWIVEAVLENPQIKSDLYKRIDPVRKKGSIISSNTSTIPLHILTEGQSKAFAQDFLITHFFNPPRYMRLLEIVAGEKTRTDAVTVITNFADCMLGKGVVPCKDTPGFIANRIGMFWMQASFNAALDLGLSVEEADAVSGKPFGIPKTGVFGLSGLIGLDLLPRVKASMSATLPKDDAYLKISRDWPLLDKLIAEGYTGRKGKGGFYRLNVATDGTKTKESVNLKTGAWGPSGKPVLESAEAGKKGLRAVVEHPDKGGKFAWAVLSQTLSYAADLVPQIADTITAVDEAMRLGFNWKAGPFEMMDQLGTAWLAERLQKEGKPLPTMLKIAAGRPFYRVEKGQLESMTVKGDYAPVKRPDGVLLLSDLKRHSKPVAKNGSASLWDIGDGVLCLEFTSKMNSIDDQIFAMARTAIDTIGDGKGDYRALVIYNESENFSVGANLGLALFALNVALYPAVEQLISEGQETWMALKYAPFPVVSAPSGMALGGGCELLLHSDAVQAHAETYTGLVEVGVGVIPGWGGCKEMLLRHAANKKRPGGPMPPVATAFENISTAKVARSAAEAHDLLILRSTDGITMNRDRQLADAKAKALELAKGYMPPQPGEIRLPGPSAKLALQMAVDGFAKQGKATPYDVVVTNHLAEVLSGGNTDITQVLSEQTLLDLEKDSFIRLVCHDGTLRRIEHMLDTGKPLRN
ncbi:MAG: 3-hydroxyacyl-CoA dehydrogenase NAD-binding domain-containing protein [Pseudomonadota bacterium]|nr:3-hydroxyacyl-CoA dehydrogenase NAD-binding domain-containing protein [Pseudomonadota bacterium]